MQQPQVAANEEPLLEMRAIGKTFPGVRALDDVDLTLHRGEVVALLGENGAGKSTLIKILGGAHLPDSGSIQIDGEPILLPSPAAAYAAGIGVIFQEFNLIPGLTAWENIFLGREGKMGFAQKGMERNRARELFQQIGVDVPVDAPCSALSVAQQQIVEIAKALSQKVRLIVMDEPSAALTPNEVDRLFDIIRDLKAQGIGVIYISHRLDEVFQIADRITVLRDGKHVGDAPVRQITRQRMIEMMVGREIEDEFPKQHHPIGDPRLRVESLNRADVVRDVSFEVRAGEVLGVTGLIGAGRTETARLIFGADLPDSGAIYLDGQLLVIRNPQDAIRAGICLLTEDRKSQGLVLGLSARENFGLPNLTDLGTAGFVDRRREHQAFAGYIDKLKIKTPSQEQLVKNLSGGNQQKVVLAKWLQRNAEVIIFDEPTRGIDVGAKYEIYLLINGLAKQGKAVVMITSELPEALGMSDRILVMHEGRVTGMIDDVSATTQEQIMELAVG
ncbi:MAG: sugar ABC transporter ATP-binding protein [Pirellulaceae bacterium]|nr:sugar ABC transporter ATP-binding protein [Pirellulaceae bacterium]